MWSTRDELEAALRQAGLGVWAPRPAAPAQHAVILELGPVEERGEVPIGASRLGGMPDLPPDMSWPWLPPLAEGSGVFKDHAARPWPLSFVAQIDFAEIQSAGGLQGYPSLGRLLLFCDPVDYPWGMSIEDQTCSSVMFMTEQHGRLFGASRRQNLAIRSTGCSKPSTSSSDHAASDPGSGYCPLRSVHVSCGP